MYWVEQLFNGAVLCCAVLCCAVLCCDSTKLQQNPLLRKGLPLLLSRSFSQ
jgi:hypothetical protein